MSEHCPICDSPLEADESVCTTCGFKFLESTQSFKPFDLAEGEIVPTADRRPTSATLRIVRGPQIEMTFHLEKGSYSVGRSPQCNIFLNDMTVSRDHALISQVPDGFSISDCNSFNGVWINNKNVNKARLCEGDIVQIGAFCLLYQESNAK
ncbi:MAG: FHA domain-containing protein [Eggerthellaceae bacterium]|jgi:hypothetical protein|nr:FHA domain-containing protein [Eggerthellaceae bacterium]MDR2715316.1 FHA domain-containing protein [Coriobacteriaceae bacterium]